MPEARSRYRVCLCSANPLRCMCAIAHRSAFVSQLFAANGTLTGDPRQGRAIQQRNADVCSRPAPGLNLKSTIAARRGASDRRRTRDRSLYSGYAPVAQRIEQWFPKPCAQVRGLPGVPCPHRSRRWANRPSNAGHGSSHRRFSRAIVCMATPRPRSRPRDCVERDEVKRDPPSGDSSGSRS